MSISNSNIIEPSSNNPVGVIAAYSNLNLPAGVSNQDIYTVPAGQRMRLTSTYIRYVGTVAGVSLILLVNIGGIQTIIANVGPPANGVYYPFNTDVLMEAGTVVRCVVVNATLNDDFDAGVALQRYK